MGRNSQVLKRRQKEPKRELLTLRSYSAAGRVKMQPSNDRGAEDNRVVRSRAARFPRTR